MCPQAGPPGWAPAFAPARVNVTFVFSEEDGVSVLICPCCWPEQERPSPAEPVRAAASGCRVAGRMVGFGRAARHVGAPYLPPAAAVPAFRWRTTGAQVGRDELQTQSMRGERTLLDACSSRREEMEMQRHTRPGEERQYKWSPR